MSTSSGQTWRRHFGNWSRISCEPRCITGTTPEKRLDRICVSDSGVGLRASLFALRVNVQATKPPMTTAVRTTSGRSA
ncbi:hypothetical protein, partial [Microbacterium sp. P5_E9]